MISKIPYLIRRIKAKSEVILRSSIFPNATEKGLYDDVIELEQLYIDALSKPSVEVPSVEKVGMGHSGKCEVGCQCDIARSLERGIAPSECKSYVKGGKVYDCTCGECF